MKHDSSNKAISLLLTVFWLSLQTGFASPILYNGWSVDNGKKSDPNVSLKQSAPGDLLLVSPLSKPGPHVKEKLEKAGFQVIAFIPRDSYLVQVRNSEKAARSPELLENVIRLDPSWKVEKNLEHINAKQNIEIPLVVHATRDSDDLSRLIEKSGGMITGVSHKPGKLRVGVKVPSDGLSVFLGSVSNHADVYSIEPGYGARLLNDNASGICQSGNPPSGRPIWQKGMYGQGQIIAVLDTGLDFDSCYFENDDGTSPPMVTGTSVGTPDPTRRKVIIYDLLYSGDYGAGADDFDNQGHGTAVSGNALGSHHTNPHGTNVYNGMAPDARLVVQDAGYTGGDNCADLPALGCPVVDLTPFLDQAYSQGARIHNNSWGDRENFSPKNLYTAPTADMDDATWRNPGFLIVCAAGNSGSAPDTVISPSTGKNVISAAASKSPSLGGDAEYIASYSSRGWAADGRIKPDLAAPGQTTSSRSDNNIYTGNCTTINIQGTSMASPVTAGCAALVRQYYMEGWHPSGTVNPGDAFTPTAALVKATLLNGAIDMSGPPLAPPNRDEGWGRIQLDRSLYFEGDDRNIMCVDERDYFTTDTVPAFTLPFRANGGTSGGEIRITLVWSDYPADPAASVSLVNDLDLVVEDLQTTNTIYYGNNIDNAPGMPGYSEAGGSRDTLNNVEMVILPPDTTGRFEARVELSLLVESPQGFALVIGGDVEKVTTSRLNHWIFYGNQPNGESVIPCRSRPRLF